MNLRNTICLLFLILSFNLKAQTQSFNGPSWLAPKHKLQTSEEAVRFVSELMDKMTLREKIGQLNLPSIGFDVTGPILSEGVEAKIDSGWVGGVFNTYTPNAVRKLQEKAVKNTRLGIPLLLGYDVIHGHRTIFPIPLGLSCTWNPELIKSTASVAAKESTADGLNWTFSPMVDISRDPRWGRVSECAGEDPYLGSMVAQAMVDGYQGGDLTNARNLMACVKHFALYGAPDGGRDYNTVDMSRYKMENDYLPPYRAAVQSGVGSIMTAFNDVNGVPSTCNTFLLKELLRKKWSFNGMIVTDYTAIEELIDHGLGIEKEVARKAIKAGAEMDMVGESYLKFLEALVRENSELENDINTACRNILLAKYRLGLFDDPYRGLDNQWQKDILSKEHRSAAKQAAEESFVLLKNKNNVLPLKQDLKIAFIGPQIKRKRDLIGNWSGAGDWKKAVSIWEAGSAIKNKRYALGCNLIDRELIREQLNQHDGQIPEHQDPKTLIDDALKVARTADVLVVALGEAFGMSGEAASMTQISLPEEQINLLRSLRQLNIPIVTVLMNGRPLVLNEVLELSDAVLECWFPGT
ncbi:MAG: glycoside hydrolase family 3 N-terminal domain-containing protein, partial [Bacteroidia bacterium]